MSKKPGKPLKPCWCGTSEPPVKSVRYKCSGCYSHAATAPDDQGAVVQWNEFQDRYRVCPLCGYRAVTHGQNDSAWMANVEGVHYWCAQCSVAGPVCLSQEEAEEAFLTLCAAYKAVLAESE